LGNALTQRGGYRTDGGAATGADDVDGMASGCFCFCNQKNELKMMPSSLMIKDCLQLAALLPSLR